MDWDYPGKNTGVGCHFLSPGHLPDSRIEPTSPALQADSLPLSHIGRPIYWILLVIQSLSRVWLFCCCCSVAKSCLTVCDPVNCSTPGFPGLPSLLEFVQTHLHWIIDTIQPSHPLCPLLLLPSIFLSIRVFFNELAHPIRWPKYWSFTFSISPTNEYSGLISFRIDWFDLLASKGLSTVFSSTTVWKYQSFSAQSFCMVQFSYLYMTTGKTISIGYTGLNKIDSYNYFHPFLFFLEFYWDVIDMLVYIHAKLLQSCPTLCNPMDCSLPGSSVHGTLQARTLGWVSLPSSRRSSQLRYQIWVSNVSWIRQADCFPLAPPGKPLSWHTILCIFKVYNMIKLNIHHPFLFIFFKCGYWKILNYSLLLVPSAVLV